MTNHSGTKANKFSLYQHKFNAIYKENKETLKQPGIYMIWNRINDHCYVGQSKTLSERKKSHFTLLNHNRHSNPYLQNAYNKYSGANFSFLVIEYCSIQDLDIKEQYWIERLQPEYNINRNVFEPWVPDKKITDGLPETEMLRKDEEFIRPDWHKWVYGGSKNPSL